MRRMLSCAFTVFFVFAIANPNASAASPSWHRRPVTGALTGPGGFRIEGCPGNVSEVGSGTFHARGLGPGTYVFDVCVTIATEITFDGRVTLTTAKGALLTGDIGGTFAGAPGPIFDVTVTGGTRPFAHARGALTIGPLVESNFSDCDPRAGVCLDWTDTGPITGTVTHVG